MVHKIHDHRTRGHKMDNDEMDRMGMMDSIQVLVPKGFILSFRSSLSKVIKNRLVTGDSIKRSLNTI